MSINRAIVFFSLALSPLAAPTIYNVSSPYSLPPAALKNEMQFEDAPDATVGRVLGPYKDLKFDLSINRKTTATGVLAQSPPQFVGYGLATAPFIGVPAISAPGAGQGAKSFDLNTIYFGCQVSTVETTVSVGPQMCGVTITAYKNSLEKGSFDMIFYPTGQQPAVNSPMVRKEIPATFKGVDQVTFRTAPSVGVGTFFDNLNITTYT